MNWHRRFDLEADILLRVSSHPHWHHRHHVVACYQTDTAATSVSAPQNMLLKGRTADAEVILSCADVSIFSLPSLARLVAMAGVTTMLGTTELTILLAHLTAKRTLPKQTRVIPPPKPAQVNLPASASPERLARFAALKPRQICYDHTLSQHLRHIADRLKQLWSLAILRVYSLDVSFTDRNEGTPHAIDQVNAGPYLFVHLNQSCLLESAAFPSASHFPTSFLMNWEFCALPFLGWNLYLTGVCIDRKNPVSAKAGADEAVRLMIEEGESVYMSIEGRRSEDGGLNTYKNGAAVIAIAAQATIVPIISRHMRDRLPYGDWRVRPGKVDMVYCDVLPTAGLTHADRHWVTQQLWDLAVKELTPPEMVVPKEQYDKERPKIPREEKARSVHTQLPAKL